MNSSQNPTESNNIIINTSPETNNKKSFWKSSTKSQKISLISLIIFSLTLPLVTWVVMKEVRYRGRAAVPATPPITPITPTHPPTTTITPTSTITPTLSPDNMTVSFKVQGVSGSRPEQLFKVNLRKNSQILFTDNQMPIASNNAGTFTFNIDTSSFCTSGGTFEILIKSSSHLQKKYADLNLACGSINFDFTSNPSNHLKASDVNDDNQLDIFDIGLILTLYTDLAVPVAPRTPQDVNFDEVITIDDIAFPLINYTDLEIPGDN